MILESLRFVWQTLEDAGVTVRALGDPRPVDPAGTAYIGDPSLGAARRTASGDYVGAVEVPVVCIALEVDRFAYVDDVLSVLAGAGVHVDTITPEPFTTGDTINPTPAYRIGVALTVTLERNTP